MMLADRYEVERPLGQGGFGIVYLARDTRLANKPVAVKQMHLQVRDPQVRTRCLRLFHEEARLLAGLSHSGLVRVTHFFEEADGACIVMEYIEGETLESIRQDVAQRLPLARVLGWMEQIADVLTYLHGQKPPVLFRDLKPANCMVTRDDRIKLIDFGLARMFDDGSGTATIIKGAGSPGYAPLEQYGEGSTDPRSDQYALAATLYAMLEGEAPPPAVGRQGVLRISHPEVTRSLESVLLKGLALAPAERYADVSEFRQAVRVAMKPPWWRRFK